MFLPHADNMPDPHENEDVAELLVTMVLDPNYPCLGARSVFRQQRATIRVYEELAGPGSGGAILRDLAEFARTTDPADGFASFVAAFRGPEVTEEQEFERLLWAQLQAVHDADSQHWNEDVSSDSKDVHFGFSAGGTSYFIVGLHPCASRQARRTPLPTLVFNLHEQFDDLRQSDHFLRMRDKIRRRDEQLQGSINPMVADHGEASEARQYSGRPVGVGWEAPFVASGKPANDRSQVKDGS